MNETLLADQLKNGDEAAFRYVVTTWQHMVFNTLLTIVQNAEDAEDLAQDVFVQVYHSIRSFKGDSKLSTWIYRIAISKALDHMRKKKAKKRSSFLHMFSASDEEATAIPDFHHPGVVLEQKELAAVLFQLIKQLPEKQQVAFLLHKTEGLSVPEISEVMQLRTGAVESLLFRAKNNLRSLLEKKAKNQP